MSSGGRLDRVLIVSLGSIGQRHMRNVRQLLPGASVAALRLTGSSAVGDEGMTTFFTLDEALAFGPDVAIVASPAPFHREVAGALIKAGVPTLVEKPFADTVDGLEALVAMAERRGISLRIAYNLRYHPLLQRIRRALAAGEIGRVVSLRAEVGQYLPDWRPQSRYQDGVSAQKALGGGALLELSHEIDYVSWLLGQPDSVFAAGGRLGDLEIDVEDSVSLLFRYRQDRRIASLHLDFLQRSVSRSVKVIGTEGTITGNLLTGQLDHFAAARGAWVSEAHPLSDPNQTYVDELREFFAAIEGGPCDLPDGRAGLGVMKLIEAARRSMQDGCEQEIVDG